jgi:hypothetical protein
MLNFNVGVKVYSRWQKVLNEGKGVLSGEKKEKVEKSKGGVASGGKWGGKRSEKRGLWAEKCEGGWGQGGVCVGEAERAGGGRKAAREVTGGQSEEKKWKYARKMAETVVRRSRESQGGAVGWARS